MSKKNDKGEAKKEEGVLKTKGTPEKVMETPKEDDFMERARLAQEEIVPILEKHEVAVVGRLNLPITEEGITAKAVFADNKKYD